MNKIIRVITLVVLSATSLAAVSAKSIELLNVSYDPTRELWRDLNSTFIPR
jgi:ABC-type sulfate transport system substrate-binding protein